MSKKVEILSGNFSTNGNFSGYDDESERYFIPKRLMEAHGWTTNQEVALPFWTKAKEKEYDTLDPNQTPYKDDKGNLIPLLLPRLLVDTDGCVVKFKRLQVLSIYKTDEDLINHDVC